MKKHIAEIMNTTAKTAKIQINIINSGPIKRLFNLKCTLYFTTHLMFFQQKNIKLIKIIDFVYKIMYNVRDCACNLFSGRKIYYVQHR